MISKPTQLPEVRAELVRWMDERGPTFFEACLKTGKYITRPALPDREAGEYWARDERKRLRMAELFWVEEPMIDLVRAAAESMPAFTIVPEDLPAPFGLIVFAKPLKVIQSPDGLDDAVHLTAASWGPWTTGPSDHARLWVSWYTDTSLNFQDVDPRRKAPASWRSLGLASLSYENEATLSFHDEPVPAVDPFTGEEIDLATDYSLPELRAAWALMQQSVASVSEAHFDRTARRRLQRQKIEVPRVRVITLRRPITSSGSGDPDREYHHQWIVRGHWRQQYYPARDVHRPIWIAPHMKGPEGAPLLGGDKVYAWRR